MVWRWLSTGFFFACICLLAAAAYLYFSTPTGFSLEIAETDMEVSGSVVGQTRDVVFHFLNHSARPMRVLGRTGTCGSNSCLDPKDDTDVLGELQPGPNEMSFVLKVRKAGGFRSQLYIWVDDDGTREIVLTVHGMAGTSATAEKRSRKP